MTDYYGQAPADSGGSTSGSASAGGNGNALRIFYGYQAKRKNPLWNGGHGNGPYYQGGGINFYSTDQHQAYFYNNWQNSAKFRTQMIRYAAALGYRTDVKSAMNLWNAAGQQSAALAKNKKYMTPMQVLAFLSGGGKGGSGGGMGGGGGGGGVSTSSSVSYDISDAHTAKALTNAVLTAALGREATDEELKSYKRALNAAEKADPSRSSSTSSGSHSSSTSESGIDGSGRQQVLMDKARATTEGQAYFTQDVFQKAMEALAGRIG